MGECEHGAHRAGTLPEDGHRDEAGAEGKDERQGRERFEPAFKNMTWSAFLINEVRLLFCTQARVLQEMGSSMHRMPYDQAIRAARSRRLVAGIYSLFTVFLPAAGALALCAFLWWEPDGFHGLFRAIVTLSISGIGMYLFFTVFSIAGLVLGAQLARLVMAKVLHFKESP